MALFVGESESYDTDAWDAYVLKKENAALRTQLADVTESMGRVEERCAKLRELAGILYYCMQRYSDCDGCRMNGAKCEVAHDPTLACDGLHEMLRELLKEDA